MTYIVANENSRIFIVLIVIFSNNFIGYKWSNEIVFNIAWTKRDTMFNWMCDFNIWVSYSYIHIHVYRLWTQVQSTACGALCIYKCFSWKSILDNIKQVSNYMFDQIIEQMNISMCKILVKHM